MLEDSLKDLPLENKKNIEKEKSLSFKKALELYEERKIIIKFGKIPKHLIKK